MDMKLWLISFAAMHRRNTVQLYPSVYKNIFYSESQDLEIHNTKKGVCRGVAWLYSTERDWQTVAQGQYGPPLMLGHRWINGSGPLVASATSVQ